MPSASEIKSLRREIAELRELVIEIRDASDELLTLDRVAAITNKSIATIREKVSSDHGNAPELTSYKRGRSRFVRRSELNRWLSEYRTTSANDLQ